MNIAKMSLEQIRQLGMQALARDLGPAGLIRFLQQYDVGHGDYTAEREGWLPESGVADLAARIRAAREGQK